MRAFVLIFFWTATVMADKTDNIPAVANPGVGVDQNSFLPWITKEEVKENPLHISLALEIPSAELMFTSKTTGSQVSYVPSLRGLFAINVTDARFFGFTAGIPISQDEKDKVEKGTTHYNDFRFNFAFARRFIQAGYTQYRGFYVNNSADVDSSWSGGPFLRAEDLYKRTLYVNSTFVYKPNRYSVESAFGQTARQVISGGSWLWGLALREEKITSPVPIIPTTIRGQFGDVQNIENVEMRSVFLRTGYGYQYNFTESFAINAYLLGGLGMKQLKLVGSDINRSETKTATKIDIQLSLVNNGKTYFGGGRMSIDNATYDARNLKIDSNFYGATLFVGRRLH
jgi:hypothetical protein